MALREIFVTESCAKSLGALPGNVRVVKKMEPLVEVRSKEDERRVVSLSNTSETIFIRCTDWMVIPLENIVAECKGKAKLVGVVKTAEEARVALQALELGVDGVLFEGGSPAELGKLSRVVEEMRGDRLGLVPATVTSVKRLGMGSRSCVDTCSMMGRGEGMLVGSSSSGMLFVQCECEENPLAAPRPFRVNAGAVALYTLAPGNRTRYVEELRAGDEVITLSRDGRTRKAFVARSKIESRPLVLVEAEFRGRVAKAVLQDAETVRLVAPEGSASVTAVKPGDVILASFGDGGRHFGAHVESETVLEK